MSHEHEEEHEMYHLKRDGEVLFTGTANECFIQLLRIQSASTYWAITYEGYSIEPKSKAKENTHE